MSENEMIATNNEENAKEPFSAKLKEWFRKKIVTLKRKPQTIALVFMLISSLIYIIGLGTLSRAIMNNSGVSYINVEWVGHAIFVNTLFSILILLLFLYTFPKRKKPNLIFAALVFVFGIIMILMDVLYYTQLSNAIETMADTQASALNLTIVHLVFQVIALVVFALIPLYSKLIRKINTRKEVASNDIKEQIDLQED